ncbi:MAG: hypothetical protein PHE26_06725 [Syntrophomonadaceae bacterium]|nr:hypothetical protein [Syntrophomonadaceae bacterium]
MKIKIGTMAILISVIIFGGIGATMAMDLWTTENKKNPVRFEDGNHAGDYNPADIRGSYTFEEISTLFGVDLIVLYQAFDVPVDTNGAEIQSKDIETIFRDSGVEIGNESMQIFVALYKGLPVVLDDETFLPTKAVNLILEMNKNLTDEQIDWMEKSSI